MRAPVTAVIPTLNAAAQIGQCLGALAEGAVEGLIREVIIADGGSTDEIAAIADASGARLITAPPGRGSQLAAGADAADAPWLLFLHADTVPGTGWVDAIRRHIADCPDQAGWFRLSYDDHSAPARLVAGWANLRSRLGLPYGDQGLLISSALYRSVGGYPPVSLMEDVALARALGRAHLTPLAARAVTSAERYRREGWLRRGWRNLSTLALYQAGVPIERLAERYRGRH